MSCSNMWAKAGPSGTLLIGADQTSCRLCACVFLLRHTVKFTMRSLVRAATAASASIASYSRR